MDSVIGFALIPKYVFSIIYCLNQTLLWLLHISVSEKLAPPQDFLSHLSISEKKDLKNNIMNLSRYEFEL